MRQKKKIFGEFESDDNEKSASNPFRDDNSVNLEMNDSASQSQTINDSPEEKPAPNSKTKKGKRAKKTPQQSTPKSVHDEEPVNLCVTCQTEFSSRNKLFQHLKSTGHSLAIGNNNTKNKKNKRR